MNTRGQHAVAADFVFDGCTKHPNAAVVIDGSQVVAILPRLDLSLSLTVHNLPEGSWLAPGFIDLQVNGGADLLFNNSPTVEAIRTIAAAHRKFGTTGLLPTFITDTRTKMATAMAAVQSLVDSEPSLLGIHLEGPFLSSHKAGVHDPQLMRAPDEADLKMLCAPRRGSVLVTLAPEQVPQGFIAELVRSGIRVSLGHSMATYEETRSAMAEGLTGFTHLFNAMRPPTAREPGPVGAALDSPAACYGLIADGFHVSPAMLRLALRGCGRPMLITDAMPPVGGSQVRFGLYDEEIEMRGGRCLRSDGTLAGAALDMATAVRNCVNLLHVPLEEGLILASKNPAEFIGVGHRLGKLAPGYRADMVALDPISITVLQTWIAGINLEPHPESKCPRTSNTLC
jgi:N-acetylglucosamine-6-phosphate deacetylase